MLYNNYSMTVPVERLDVEPARDFDHAIELMGRVLQGSLPCFVMDTVDVTRSFIEAHFEPVITSHNFVYLNVDEQVTISDAKLLGENTEPERPVRELGVGPIDFYPHFDFPPYDTGPIVSVVNMHLTTQGSVRSSFYEMASDYLALRPAALRQETVRSIQSGEVDPTIINPRYFSTVLNVGHLAVFRTGGHSPLIHHFQTESSPRNSFVMRAVNTAGLF
jgi:hypothetical protein